MNKKMSTSNILYPWKLQSFIEFVVKHSYKKS